jgi:hypothetical protein
VKPDHLLSGFLAAVLLAIIIGGAYLVVAVT